MADVCRWSADGRYSINTREGGRLKTIEIANALLEEGYDEGEGDTHRNCQPRQRSRDCLCGVHQRIAEQSLYFVLPSSFEPVLVLLRYEISRNPCLVGLSTL